MSPDRGRIYEAQTSLGRLSNLWKVEGLSGLPVRSQNCESQAPVVAVLTVGGEEGGSHTTPCFCNVLSPVQ